MMPDGEPAREDSENELLRSTAVLHALPNGVVLCDRAGTVRCINPAAARLLGVDVDQWLSRPLADLPYGVELSNCAVGEVSKIGFDGQSARFRVLPVWSTVDPSQQIGRLVLLDEWISELESSRHLLAIISHELRAPITTMIGNVELLNRELLGPISVDQRESLHIIARLGARIRDVINDVMTLSSIQDGSIYTEVEPVSIIGMFQEILPSFAQQYRDQAIEPTISIPDDLPPVAGGAYAIRTIFSKLLDNAYRYTLPAGQIMIRGKRVGQQVRIDIQDTGIGISDSAKPHVFIELIHDYANQNISSSRYSHGISMSLVIVKKLIDLYGGSIWFESTVGQGSTFSLTLPILEAI